MSNIFSHNTNSVKRKLIQIKQIEVEEHDPVQVDNLEEEHISIQEKIRLAHEELQQIVQQKEQKIADTNALIDQEKEKWQEEKQIYIKQAHEKGYNDGFALGKQESTEQYQQLIDKANAIIDSATVDYHSTIEQSDEVIVDLAIHTAEKIIKQKFADDPASFLPIVKTAIKEIKDQSILSIYVHPDNYEFVVQQKDELVRLVDSDSKLSIYIKDELKQDSCLIEHPFGKIDASIDTQLKQLRKVLHEIVGGE